MYGNAYLAHPQHVPHLVGAGWSFGPGREAAATGQPRGLWRSLRARLKALDVLLAAGDTGSAEARSHEPCSDADTRDRTIAKLPYGNKDGLGETYRPTLSKALTDRQTDRRTRTLAS